jgi:hypothetical protein
MTFNAFIHACVLLALTSSGFCSCACLRAHVELIVLASDDNSQTAPRRCPAKRRQRGAERNMRGSAREPLARAKNRGKFAGRLGQQSEPARSSARHCAHARPPGKQRKHRTLRAASSRQHPRTHSESRCRLRLAVGQGWRRKARARARGVQLEAGVGACKQDRADPGGVGACGRGGLARGGRD